jgi:hypothetical protein
VRCEEVSLHSIKEAKNILRTIKRRKADWIGRIMPRNCLLKCVIEANVGGIEALYRTLWKTRFGRGYGPVVRQATR